MPLQLVGIPFKSCSHTKKEENYSLHREPAREHKALSGTSSVLYARCSQSYGKALKTGAYHDKQKNWIWKCPTLFLMASQTCLAQGELSSGLTVIMTGENVSTHNDQRRTTNIVAFFQAWEKYICVNILSASHAVAALLFALSMFILLQS